MRPMICLVSRGRSRSSRSGPLIVGVGWAAGVVSAGAVVAVEAIDAEREASPAR